ncbi:MAG: fibronectin type III domain-containing protein [Acidobacteriota bacterium]
MTAAASAWDRARDVIYTRVTVEVHEVLKGWVPDRPLVLAQLGGTADGFRLHIDGQPALRPGDEVLLLLARRSRDGSWYAQAAFDCRGDDAAAMRAAVLARTGGAALVDPARLAPVSNAAHAAFPLPARCPGALRGAPREATVFADVCQELGQPGQMVSGTWWGPQGQPLARFAIVGGANLAGPTGLTVTVTGRLIQIQWNAVAGALGYRVDFRQATGGPVLATQPATTNSLSVTAPGEVSGTFTAEVVALTPGGPTDPSAPVAFTVGAGGTCTAPPDPPTGGEGYVRATGPHTAIASVWWDPLDEPINWFHVRAWDLVRGGQIFNQAVGSTREVTAEVGPGFMARVEVSEVNVCGESAPLVIIVR